MRRCLLALIFLVAAMPVSAQSARQQWNVFSRGLQTASASFQQVVTGPNGEMLQSAQGLLEMQAPNRFRWEYAKPSRQLIIADGHKIWIYEPDLRQVTVKPQDALNADNPLSALASPQTLERFYTVSELPEKQGMRWLQLLPKHAESSPFDKAWLGFDGVGLRRMRLYDNLGQVSEFSFSRWKRNPVLAENHFRFTVPKNVDLVE